MSDELQFVNSKFEQHTEQHTDSTVIIVTVAVSSAHSAITSVYCGEIWHFSSRLGQLQDISHFFALISEQIFQVVTITRAATFGVFHPTYGLRCIPLSSSYSPQSVHCARRSIKVAANTM